MNFLSFLVIITHFFSSLSLHHNGETKIQEEIAMTNAIALIDEYSQVSDFWNDKNNALDPEKYAHFIGLFENNSMHFNDLRKGKSNLTYYEYAEQVMKNMDAEGINFEIEKAEISSCTLDSVGFYQINVEVRKRVFTQIKHKGKTLKLNKGKRVNLNFQIEIPLYDLEKPLITAVELKEENLLINSIRFLNKRFRN